MKYIKTFEANAYGKTKQTFFDFSEDVYVTFSDYEGKERYIPASNGKNFPNYEEEKKKVLNMLKEYYDIEENVESYIMRDESWSWRIRFYDSFGKPGIDINIITTTGWTIDKTYNQITAKEFLKIGLENLETYFSAKKYNL